MVQLLRDVPLGSAYTWGLDLSGSVQGAGGIGGLVAAQDLRSGSAKNYWFLYDANGNVGQVLDATNLSAITTAAKYEYDPYGNTIAATGTYAAANPFRFSTKWFDTETGLSYYGYRYYSERLGRWMSRDPISEQGGMNLYCFSNNAPAGYVDLRGLGPYTVGSKPPPNPYEAAYAESDRTFGSLRGQSDEAGLAYIKSKAKAAVLTSSAMRDDDAAEALDHFLNESNGGLFYYFNYSEFIKEDQAGRDHYYTEQNDARAFIESHFNEIALSADKSIVSVQANRALKKPITKNWFRTFGNYVTWARAKNIKCTKDGYEMTLVVTIWDNYDWDVYADGVGPLDQDELKVLHYAGWAREYRVTAVKQEVVRWKTGQRVPIGKTPGGGYGY